MRMLPMLLAGLLVVTQGTSQPAAVAHDRAFWRAIMQRDYAPPEGAAIEPLLHELSGYLASPDPELRDELAYSILTAWIAQKNVATPAMARALMTEWSANLKHSIGSRDTDAVFRRSFSALMLSVIVAHDNAAMFLDQAEVDALLAGALAYLQDERDLRGFDARKGWMHSAAHTADLLKFLARSRFLRPADQARLLDAITRKLSESPEVFTFGEDERFARAILSIVNRQDFDAAGFAAWVARATPKGPRNSLPDPAVLVAYQNMKNLFTKLDVLLTLQEPSTPATKAALEALRPPMKKLF